MGREISQYIQRASLTQELRISLTELSESEDTELLARKIKEFSAMTVTGFYGLAVCATRMVELGLSFEGTGLSPKFVSRLCKVAYGQINVDLAFHFGHNAALMNAAQQLPLPDQQAIASDVPIAVWEPGGTHRMVSPSRMSRLEIRQVFSGEHIRDAAEQQIARQEIQEQMQARAMASKRAVDEVVVDKKRSVAIIGGVVCTAKQLAVWLSELS